MHSNGTLLLTLTLDAPLDAQCGYSLKENVEPNQPFEWLQEDDVLTKNKEQRTNQLCSHVNRNTFFPKVFP